MKKADEKPIWTIKDRIRFLVDYYKQTINDPVELAYRVLNCYIDWDGAQYTKEFKELWAGADYYWVIIQVQIKRCSYIKWRMAKGYEFPKEYNVNFLAREIIKGIDEVVDILREKCPGLESETDPVFSGNTSINVRVKVMRGYMKVVEYEKATYALKYFKPAEIAILFLEEFDKIMNRARTRRIK